MEQLELELEQQLEQQLELELQQQLELELQQQLQLELQQQLQLQLVLEFEPQRLQALHEAQQADGQVHPARTLSSLPGLARSAAGTVHGGLGRRAAAPAIEFLCVPEDRGVIAEPVPAGSELPPWFRRLPGVDPEALAATNNALTVKRCLPFLDAMSLGWLLPLAATVRLELADGGTRVDAGWEHDQTMVSAHGAFQAAGNPWAPRPVMKFHNPWTIRTSPGWSCAIVPPLNRPGGVVEILSGVVDTDRYVTPVNLPFVAVGDDGVHSLAQGTPLAQVIPFRRDAAALACVVREEHPDEADERERLRRATQAGQRWYQRHARAAR